MLLLIVSRLDYFQLLLLQIHYQLLLCKQKTTLQFLLCALLVLFKLRNNPILKFLYQNPVPLVYSFLSCYPQQMYL